MIAGTATTSTGSGKMTPQKYILNPLASESTTWNESRLAWLLRDIVVLTIWTAIVQNQPVMIM